MRLPILLPITLLLASSAYGQVSVPLLGYLPDGSQVRPVYGIPMAAAVAAPLNAGQDFAQIAVSPAQDFILVSAASGAGVSILKPGSELIPLKGAGAAPDLIAMSPRGSASVLWFDSNKRAFGSAQLVSGLPASPAIRQIRAPFLGSVPTALAVSDDGQWLAGAWPGGLYAFGPQGQVFRLPVDESVAALAFFPGSENLAVATQQRVVSVAGISGFAVVSPLYDFGNSPLNILAMAVSSDSGSVIMADRGGSILDLDIGTGIATTADCACQPEGLFAMGSSAFRLTGLHDGAFKLFDPAHNEVLFVPLALSSGGGQ